MSDLAKLAGKGKKVKIGELEIEVKPLTVSDMDLMMDIGDENKRTEATKKLITKVLKEGIPDSTDEEINNISVKHLTPLMEAISEVCGIETNSKSDFIKKIKERQSGK